jgi:hypothetical protein
MGRSVRPLALGFVLLAFALATCRPAVGGTAPNVPPGEGGGTPQARVFFSCGYGIKAIVSVYLGSPGSGYTAWYEVNGLGSEDMVRM